MLGLAEQVVFGVDGCSDAETFNLARLPPGTLVLESRGVESDRYKLVIFYRVDGVAYARNKRSSIRFYDQLVCGMWL